MKFYAINICSNITVIIDNFIPNENTNLQKYFDNAALNFIYASNRIK